jgi:hypothetical protein
MLFQRKKDFDPDNFWKEYEEKIQEKVLAKALGRYISGWAEYPEPMWGLVIATSGGFRFHHFPHEGWLVALTRATTGGKPPEEKTIFIPKEKINAAAIYREQRWWKKLFSPSPPVLSIRYQNLDGSEGELAAETELAADKVCAAIDGLLAAPKA